MVRKAIKLALVICGILILSACAQTPRQGGIVEMFGYGEDLPDNVSIQNEFLRLEFLTETAEIVVTELATGNQWRSTPEGAADLTPAEAAPIARFHMQSMFLLEYQNRHGHDVTLDGYRFARNTGRYEHAIVDGGLELMFTAGDIPEIFQIPMAIYSDRMEYFRGQLTADQARFVTQAYRLIRLDRMRPQDNPAEFIERFPMLEEGAHIYELRDTIRPHMQATIQDYLRDVGYTTEEWVYDMEYFGMEVDLDRPAFNVVMRFELVDNSMVLSIPFNRLTHSPSYLPTRLTVMPFFGAGYVEDDGYLFVPDGSGALMHFNSGRYTQEIYFNNIFGHDQAVVRDALIHDNIAAYPVFGVYRNGTTFAGIIEEGASYGAVRAELSGWRSPFSAVHPTFRLIHGAAMDVVGRSDRPFHIHEYGLPEYESIVIRYVFTEQPGYVGMAVAYREFLQARYPWLNNRLESPVNAMVEILGAAETRQHVLGFPVDRPFPLTTFDQATEMLDTFNNFGWNNVHVMFRGAHNDSIDHSVPTSLDLVSQLGNRNAFNNLLNTSQSHGYEFYLEGDFVHMRHLSMFDGFNQNREAARQVNRQRVQHNGFSPTYFAHLGTGSILATSSVLARPAFTMNLVNNFVNEASQIGVNNIAFRSMASSLAGDFHETRHVTREESMHMRADLLRDLRDRGTGIWLHYGFSYGMPFADIITSMPVTDQVFGVTDTVVPFYQIALHGLVHFAGSPVNLAEDYSYHLLRSMESGSSLFFSFMNVPTADLEVTRYRRYFANEFGRWSDIANMLYQNRANQVGHLYNQLIVDHQLLATGVSVSIFEDGTRVYVNTSLVDYDGAVSIPSRRYLVVR